MLGPPGACKMISALEISEIRDFSFEEIDTLPPVSTAILCANFALEEIGIN